MSAIHMKVDRREKSAITPLLSITSNGTTDCMDEILASQNLFSETDLVSLDHMQRSPYLELCSPKVATHGIIEIYQIVYSSLVSVSLCIAIYTCLCIRFQWLSITRYGSVLLYG
jgi:hypothetical protein